MTVGISIREFARRDGVSSTLVKRGKDRGAIRTFEDGSLDPACVGTGWCQSNRRGAEPVSVHTDAPELAESAHEASVDSEAAANAQAAINALTAFGGLFDTFADADRARVSYIAHLRQIEYEHKRGKLIEIEAVTKRWEETCGQVRNRLLAIPSGRAPQMFRCKTVAELQDALMAVMVEVLEELSRGGPSS